MAHTRQMDVLLINPSIDFSKFGKFGILLEPMPTIGLAYLAAMLERERIKTRIVDAFAFRRRFEDIYRLIEELRPRVVGLSCLTPSAPECYRLGREVKSNMKDCSVVMGNVHADVFAREIIENGYADAVVHGEGEPVVVELVKRLLDRTPVDGIRGVTQRDTINNIVSNLPAGMVQDLDSLPLPAWHLFPLNKYGLLPFADIRKPVLTVMGSRGCPFRCTYCALRYQGQTVRRRAVSKVVDEIEYLAERFRIRQFGFVDPIFPIDKKQCLDFCAEMVRRGLNKKIVWITETRADILDSEMAKHMKEAGLRRIIFGIEAGDEGLLRTVGKNQCLDKVREGVENAKKAGLEVIGLFMIGLPGETVELTRKTIDFAKGLPLDFAKFAITVPFPGSRLYEQMRESGLLARTDWENFTTFNPDPQKLVCATQQIEPSMLLKMQRRANFSFYFRPRMILRQLLLVRTLRISDMLKGILAFLPHFRKTMREEPGGM